MSDRDEITDVLIRYASGIDGRDWTLLRACFTADARFDYGPLGTWSSADDLVEFMRKSHSGPSMHRLSNMVITVDGDRATSRTYVDAVVTGPGGAGGANQLGYYDDDLSRTAEGWRITSRRFTGVRITMLGPLRVLPSALAAKLSAIGSRRMAAGVTKP